MLPILNLHRRGSFDGDPTIKQDKQQFSVAVFTSLLTAVLGYFMEIFFAITITGGDRYKENMLLNTRSIKVKI